MEGEYNREPDSSGEVKEAQAPSTPSLSTRGQMNMSTPLPPEPSEPTPPEPTTSEPLQSTPETKPPAAVVTDEQPAASVAAPPPPSTTETIDTTVAEKPTAPVQTLEMYERPKENPLPRPDNPETEEVSGSKEIGLGRDDGLPAATNVPVDDPTAAGRRRMQEALDPTDVSIQQNDSTVTPSTEIDNTTSASSSPLSADDSILPPVSPSLPSGASDALLSTDTPPTPQKPSSDDLIKFRTDYSTDDLGGAANEINAENADINKANRELFEARKEAERIQAETGMTMEEYLKEANLRLLHPELFVSTDPQEVMNSNVPVSPSLPSVEKENLPSDAELSGVIIAPSKLDTDISLPPVSPPLPAYNPAYINADTSIPEVLPDGSLAVISGNPEIKKQFTHQQGTSTLEYITPEGIPLKYEGTCGIVSCEDVARQQGVHVSEDELVRFAAENNLCVNDAPNSGLLGGTTDEQRAEILDRVGIPNEIVTATSMEELAKYIENNQSAIAAVNAGSLWNDANFLWDGFANHAVVVTGVARSPQSGDILGFFINDSGAGEAGKFVSASRFKSAWLNRGGRLNLTLPRK